MHLYPFFYGMLLLGTAIAALPAHAQSSPDTVRAATRQVVEDRVDGPKIPRQSVQQASGGVRIRVRNDSRPRILIRRPVPASMSSDSIRGRAAVLPTGITARDLDLLEARLAERIDQRFDALMAASLRPEGISSNTPMVQDTYGPTAVVPTSGVERPAVGVDSASAMSYRQVISDRPPLDVTPTLEYIERLILEEGLFQTTQVNFEINQSTLLASSIPVLTALGDVLVRYSDVRLEIGGHTDSRGSKTYNQRLSEARAEAVTVYLVSHFPLDAARLHVQGFGESQPIADNDTATGRVLNRRVTFRVLNP